MASIEEMCSMQREKSFPNVIWKWVAKKKEILAYLMAWPTLEREGVLSRVKNINSLKKKQSKTRTVIWLKTSSGVEATLQWIEEG